MRTMIQVPQQEIVARAVSQNIPLANILPFPVDAIQHPEIGWVLDEQEGAQSPGSAYDQGQGPDGLFKLLLKVQVEMNEPILDAVLASDGWWWRICHPWKYGLVD